MNHGDTENTESQFIDVYPDAVCPGCGSQAAIRIPASRVGKSHDFILCFACGQTSIVNSE